MSLWFIFILSDCDRYWCCSWYQVPATVIMAFLNKVGNVLRQGAAQRSQAPVASMLNYIRCMSSSKLFIGGIQFDFCLQGSCCWIQTTCRHWLSFLFHDLAFASLGLSYGVDDKSLEDAFSSFGRVAEGEFSLCYIVVMRFNLRPLFASFYHMLSYKIDLMFSFKTNVFCFYFSS